MHSIRFRLRRCRNNKKEKIESSPLHYYHQQIGKETTESKNINSKNITERTLPFDRTQGCNSIFSSLIAFRHTLWKARHARQHDKRKRREEQEAKKRTG